MKLYLVCGYDEDYYWFETFKGIFTTFALAENFIFSNKEKILDDLYYVHQNYIIYEVKTDITTRKVVAQYECVDSDYHLELKKVDKLKQTMI